MKGLAGPCLPCLPCLSGSLSVLSPVPSCQAGLGWSGLPSHLLPLGGWPGLFRRLAAFRFLSRFPAFCGVLGACAGGGLDGVEISRLLHFGEFFPSTVHAEHKLI